VADNLPDVYLRFVDVGIQGESMDAGYPGEEGWIGIKSFTFGFGWGGSDAGGKEAPSGGKGATPAGKAPASSGKGAMSGGKDGTLTPREFSFSKSPDVASNLLLEKCRNPSDSIPKVEVVVCRAAGVDDNPKIPKDAKIPFLRLVFEKVTLKKCSLAVSSDPVPAESVEFKFGKVTMETVWTDNATGTREPGEPLRVFFDFKEQKGTSSWGEEA
jgi:type VI protein secretion system component Hcp